MLIKAVGLFSGGLDSLISLRLMLEQGLNVLAVHFTSPFLEPLNKRQQREKKQSRLQASIERIAEGCAGSAQVEIIDMSDGFLNLLHYPKHGYGGEVNPCLDCHIHMLKLAMKLMWETGADFVFTGEVLKQRPMSQQLHHLGLVARRSGLGDRLLRPLSARLLPETLPEREGRIDRDRLLDIQGRQRVRQIEYLQSIGVDEFPGPAGGCILTETGFANKVRDLWKHRERDSLTWNDYRLLQTGRHLRINPQTKLVVGRNEKDNEALDGIRGERIRIEIDDIPGPVAVIDADPEAVSAETIQLAAGIVGRYSDGRGSTDPLPALITRGLEVKRIFAVPLKPEQIDKWKIS